MAEKYLVEGYEFDTIEEANEAKKELEAVKFMSAKTESCPPQEILLLYKKIISENMFKTPVGLGYVETLKEYLKENGMFNTDANVSSNKVIIKETQETIEMSPKPKKSQETKPKEVKKSVKAKTTKKTEKKKLVDEILEKPKPKKEKVKTVEMVEAQLKKTKDKLTTSRIINVLLTMAILAMIYIASTSSNINILNYETALLDKYSTWAEELQDKETELKEREKALKNQ